MEQMTAFNILAVDIEIRGLRPVLKSERQMRADGRKRRKGEADDAEKSGIPEEPAGI